jgi:hypothetical protein
MALYMQYPDYDYMFKNTIKPIIVNNIPYTTMEDRNNFTKILLTTYNSDVLSPIPSCACERLQGAIYTPKGRPPAECEVCNTVVSLPSEESIDLKTWVCVPEGVKCFISPIVYHNLSKILNARGYNLLEWILNPRSSPAGASKKTLKRIEYLVSIGWKRGINAFYDNFDKFLEILTIFCKHQGASYGMFLKERQHLIFPKALPLPTRAMLVLENTPVGSFSDPHSISGAMDAARTIASFNIPKAKATPIHTLESKCFTVMKALVGYSVKTIRSTVCSHKGWLRGQLASWRANFSLRAVITSKTEPHDYRELEIPWTQGLELLKYHILNKLVNKHKYSFLAGYNLIENNGNTYHPLLDQLMQEIIAETPVQKFTGNYELSGISQPTQLKKEVSNIVKTYGYDLIETYLLNHTLDAAYSSPLSNVINTHGIEVINNTFFSLYDKTFQQPLFGLCNIFQRNPSLVRLSMMCLYLTKVKTDPLDKTISFSILVVRGATADKVYC